MNKIFQYIFTTFISFPLIACHRSHNKIVEYDNKSYINDFELLQQNNKNDTRILITSPKAIIDPKDNDIDIFNSSIKIENNEGEDVNVISGNSSLNNSTNLIRVYNKVQISLIDKKDSFINTNSFEWDLNSSIIDLNSPLDINFDNTKISSTDGTYNIDSSKLKINNNIFKRNILNKRGQKLYQIKILADKANWQKDNNSLEFTSINKQVETTIDFLNTKQIK